MTDQEIKRKDTLEKKLSYGEGICLNEWTELIELRKKGIIANGGNPNHYNLENTFCTKKLVFRK